MTNSYSKFCKESQTIQVRKPCGRPRARASQAARWYTLNACAAGVAVPVAQLVHIVVVGALSNPVDGDAAGDNAQREAAAEDRSGDRVQIHNPRRCTLRQDRQVLDGPCLPSGKSVRVKG